MAVVAIVLVVLLLGTIALFVFAGISVQRANVERRRQRVLEAFHLPPDGDQEEVVRNYLRRVVWAKFAGFFIALLVSVAVAFILDWFAPEPTRAEGEVSSPQDVALLAVQFALWYTGALIGGAFGAATVLRQRRSSGARASLTARDVAAYVPPVCVRSTFLFGSLAVLGALVMLIVGSPDWDERIYLGIASAVAVFAMTVMVPLANRLAQMPMAADADRNSALDEALRHVSARMVAGDAVLMVAAALGVVGALLMPNYAGALIVLCVFMFPAAMLAQYLQPGERVPRRWLRWLDAPRASEAP
jgi:hypothetical protein